LGGGVPTKPIALFIPPPMYLPPEFLDVGLRLRQKILRVAVLIFDINFSDDIGWCLGLRV
jgi:hypothetical protein